MKSNFKLLAALFIFIIIFILYVHCLKYVFYSTGRWEPENFQASELESRIAQTDMYTLSPIVSGRKKINVLLLGIEGKQRADTILFVNYDSEKNKINIISIPRDTYYHEKNHDSGDQRKINAEYGREKESGCVEAVSKLLCGIPADYYISIDYEGVERIVDIIQGVEVEVPLDMEVGGVELKKGRQVLMGHEALQYLRFRKKYPDGDLGRVKAQQKFIKAVLEKVRYSNLPDIVRESFKSIRTNMPMKYMVEYARKFNNDGVEELSMYTLPGAAMYKYINGYNWSYFFHNPQKTSELVNKINGMESMEQKRRRHCVLN